MAATLQQYPTTFLMIALYDNPTAKSFPWENGFTRAQVVQELQNRSGEGDVSQIVSSKAVVGTDNGTTVTDKKHIK